MIEPIGYEELNLNFNLYFWSLYNGFMSRTWISSIHSSKFSADMSWMPGGRL